MAVKQISFDESARKALLEGVSKLAAAVKARWDRAAAMRFWTRVGAAPTVTKDGVTVAEEIELSNKFENVGAQLVKEAASKTSRCCRRWHDHGDGAGRGDFQGRVSQPGRRGGCDGAGPRDQQCGRRR